LTGQCLTDLRCGAAPGEACNFELSQGPLVDCANDLCVGGRCNQLCDASHGCQYSPALVCEEGLVLFDDLPEDTFGLCFGRACAADVDCQDAAFSCELFLDETGTAIAPACAYVGEGPDYGEACSPQVPCGRGFCLTDEYGAGWCAATCTGFGGDCPVPGEHCQLIGFYLDEQRLLTDEAFLCAL